MNRTRNLGEKPKLDDIDFKILDAMEFQARISNAALAKVVGLSESATLERVRRLERSGVIQGYSTRIDGSVLGQNISALVTIRMAKVDGDGMENLIEKIRGYAEVLAFYQVMGSCEFVAHVAAGDVDALEQLLTSKFFALPEVERTGSMLVLRSIKRQFDPPETDAN